MLHHPGILSATISVESATKVRQSARYRLRVSVAADEASPPDCRSASAGCQAIAGDHGRALPPIPPGAPQSLAGRAGVGGVVEGPHCGAVQGRRALRCSLA